MKSDNPTLSVLKSVLGKKVVSYHPIFARALRSVPAAVMLSQAYFWQESAEHKDLKEIDGKFFFTKTAAEWYEATGVTDDAQVTARNVLCNSGIWFEKRSGVPAKLYFHIDVEVLVSVIYGYLNSGIQVTVDNRSKNREYTRASSGKFRPPVSVNYGNTNKVESNKRVLERRGRVDAHAENLSDFENQKKEKTSPVAPHPSATSITTFADSLWAKATTGAFATALHQYDEKTADADAGYYLARCRDWSAQNPDKRKANWLAFAAQIIQDDRKKQKLVTLQPSQNGTGSSHNSSERLSDKTRIIERSIGIAERLGYKVG